MEINCLHFTTLDSTNNWCKNHFTEFDKKNITLVTTDEQTMGRGQFNRKWLSPANKNIYATFTFFLNRSYPRERIGLLTQELATIIIAVLKSYNIEAMMKWPNDVLVNKKKIAGILTETVEHDEMIVVIMGFGINVNMTYEELAKIDQPATSIYNECGSLIEIASVLEKIKKNLADWNK